jgi:ubiquitin-activating enzyme E1
MTTDIDMNLYDRQVRTFGKDASHKLGNSIVYLYNLAGGLGGEIAKNLALSGIKNIFLVDSENIDSNDAEFSYYYKPENIGQSRCDILTPYIQELNPHTQVIPIKHTDNFWKNIAENSCVVVINTTLDNTIYYNGICRKKNIKMVYLRSSGLAGFIFVDALENHQVYDLSGENIEPVQVKTITPNGKISCEEHNFQHGDTISFTNLQGTNIEFFESEWIVRNTTKFSFEIVSYDSNDFTQHDFNFINGTAILIRKPTVFNHQSLKEQIDSGKTIIGFNQETSENIINAFPVLEKFRYDNIHPWASNINFDNFDETLYPLVRSYGIEIGPVNSIMGGFTSAEVIKLVTNKYTPISQWFTWNDFSLLQKYKPLSLDGSKLEQLFGTTFVNKLKNLNIFMVGCGALGCEWLKNLALLNVATEDGVIDVTDPDHIEKSNLSRQFLFRSENIGQSKSIVAADAIRKLNQSISINSYLEKVSSENNQFTQRIFRNKDVVISALDNIEARRYIDGQIFSKNLPLFESGTMGMKGNTQPVIPYLTETYSNSSDPEEEKEFAVCTIKNFPNQIQHTIHWARDYFELFNRAPQNVNRLIQSGLNKDVLDTLTASEKNQAIEDINLFLGKYNPIMFEECLIWATDIFEKEFNHSIKQLLHCFPKDHMIDGNLFWSHGKRCPEPLKYDITVECVVDFLEATTHILCRCFNLEENFNRSDIITWIAAYELNDFTPDDNVTIAKVDSEIKESTQTTELELQYKDFDTKYESNCFPQEFEKDDETNWHVAWLTAASNCRATVYNIPTVSQYETKGIAGRIIPAVATTTATVVGFISLEMMKYVANQQNQDIDYQSWFVNMADNTSIGAEPVKAKELKYGETTVNGWTKIKCNDNKTLQGFIDYFQEFFKVEISMILHKSTIIYASFISQPDKLSKNLLELFKDNYQIDLTQEKLYLTIATEDEEIVLPEVILDLTNIQQGLHLSA